VVILGGNFAKGAPEGLERFPRIGANSEKEPGAERLRVEAFKVNEPLKIPLPRKLAPPHGMGPHGIYPDPSMGHGEVQRLRESRQTEGQREGSFTCKGRFHRFLTRKAKPLPRDLTTKIEGHVVTLKPGLQARHGLEPKVSLPGLASPLPRRLAGRRGDSDTGLQEQ